jgi:polysaccharide biosynthesis protein PslF
MWCAVGIHHVSDSRQEVTTMTAQQYVRSMAVDPRRHGSPSGRLDAIVVGTYPPTRCGLATFSANTRRGLLSDERMGLVDVLRLGAPPHGVETKAEVHSYWPRGGDPAEAAEACARYDVVLLQHEFGIYDGHEGDSVLDIVDVLEVPVVSVLHTVLVDPSGAQRRIVEALAERSVRSIVLSQSAADRLTSRYRVDRDRVRTIRHGAEPNRCPPRPSTAEPPTLLTWGLLGPGKGIEHAVKAVAVLAGRGLQVRYVVAGQTHPNVVAAEGEHYREALRALAGELGVAQQVEFDDAYRDWHALHALECSADIVVLPYDSREQVTSGVLVEALAAAKPVVATAFPHAVEILPGRAGLVVPHEEPEALADAIERLLTEPDLRRRCEQQARAEGALHAWPVVGRACAAVLEESVVQARDGWS